PPLRTAGATRLGGLPLRLRLEMKERLVLILAAAALFAGGWYLFGRPPTFQRVVNPGGLSEAHAFLGDDCMACHTPGKGVAAVKCITCHANDIAMLQRQPTAFHANVQSCRECHAEHQGLNSRPVGMNHDSLVSIGLRELEKAKPDSSEHVRADELKEWIRVHRESASAGIALNPGISAREATLNCATCHETKDPHFGLFGMDCAACHAAESWSIAAFQHPSPSSTSCAQCHQAPPSHYMGHFNMISRKVAGQPKAVVSQCYLCHQTTSWPDIRGAGFYKHH
ncbi:MAG: cytochrome c3 family protein, partial [Chthoniobacterales bacterium]